jgi:Ras GTPase-activating protein 3
VFPLANYDHLLNLLIQSIDQRPITTSAVYLLGEMVANKQEIAQPLVRLFTHNNRIVDIIQRLAEWEICKLTDPTTIFRGNTLVSKMMDEAMKLSGLHYLHSTLRPIVELILHEKKCCEIDPARIKEKISVEQNLKNLLDYVEKVFDAIIKSAPKCPQVLCEIFHNMRESATKFFPENQEVSLTYLGRHYIVDVIKLISCLSPLYRLRFAIQSSQDSSFCASLRQPYSALSYLISQLNHW